MLQARLRATRFISWREAVIDVKVAAELLTHHGALLILRLIRTTNMVVIIKRTYQKRGTVIA